MNHDAFTRFEDEELDEPSLHIGLESLLNIFGNKYGQHLAGVQVRREEREEQKKRPREEEEEDVVGRSTGPGVWGEDDEEVYGDAGGEKRARTE